MSSGSQPARRSQWTQPHPAPCFHPGNSHGRQQPLGVIPASVPGTGQWWYAPRAKSRQQQRRLELCAGHRQRVIDRRQGVTSVDPQGRRSRSVRLDDLRPHGAKRLGHAAHGPTPQRFIARQHALEGLRGQQVPPSSRMPVPELPRFNGFGGGATSPPRPTPSTRSSSPFCRADLNPHRLQGRERGEAIFAPQEAA